MVPDFKELTSFWKQDRQRFITIQREKCSSCWQGFPSCLRWSLWALLWNNDSLLEANMTIFSQSSPFATKRSFRTQHDGLFVFYVLFDQELLHPFCQQLELSASKEEKVGKTKKHYEEKNSGVKKFLRVRKDNHEWRQYQTLAQLTKRRIWRPLCCFNSSLEWGGVERNLTCSAIQLAKQCAVTWGGGQPQGPREKAGDTRGELTWEIEGLILDTDINELRD